MGFWGFGVAWHCPLRCSVMTEIRLLRRGLVTWATCTMSSAKTRLDQWAKRVAGSWARVAKWLGANKLAAFTKCLSSPVNSLSNGTCPRPSSSTTQSARCPSDGPSTQTTSKRTTGNTSAPSTSTISAQRPSATKDGFSRWASMESNIVGVKRSPMR